MKYTKYLLFLLVALAVSACGGDDKNEIDPDPKPDPKPEVVQPTATQKWIEDTMRKEYYWYKEIKSELTYKDVEPVDFFTNMLSDKDGKTDKYGHYYYSTIEEAGGTRGYIQEDYSYGFDFTFANFEERLYALILYVLPNSPAYEAGLKRGDWISLINNTPLNDSNYRTLYGGGAATFKIAEWVDEKGFIDIKDVAIGSARAVDDNPVFHYDILTSPKTEKKVGYLVYNHFTDGPGDGSEAYDDDLRTMSSILYGVEEFVLDLRYNNGGLLTSAILLCSILAPENTKCFGYLQYNDQKSPNRYWFNVDKDYPLPPHGKNLNLPKVYVLVSNMSASASEMVINSLRACVGDANVILIGEQTEGKNVGSSPFTSDDKKWTMRPITCQIFNVLGFTDYANGFTPDYEMHEWYTQTDRGTQIDVKQLGDPEERLLKAALTLIDGGTLDTTTRSDVSSSEVKPTSISSISRRATNGVIINIGE